jgi:hypothetical protein
LSKNSDFFMTYLSKHALSIHYHSFSSYSQVTTGLDTPLNSWILNLNFPPSA